MFRDSDMIWYIGTLYFLKAACMYVYVIWLIALFIYVLIYLFDVGLLYVAKAAFKLIIFLLQLSEYWDYRCVHQTWPDYPFI